MLTFRLLDYQIYISENVLNIFSQYSQQQNNMHEAGGILLGQVYEKSIYIIKASIPSEFDKRSRYSFERSKVIAQLLIEYEFINSNNKTIYLGEWHTHPENIPTPSSQDLKMIKNQKKLGKFNENFILYLIQGIQKLYIGIYEEGKFSGIVVDRNL